MSGKYSFYLKSAESRSDLPHKIIIGQQATETPVHVLLKMLGYLIFQRERLQIETHLHLDHIPFIPDLVQLDYELRPRLWIECGECSVSKLHKLAVKAPDAELWILKKSTTAAEELFRAMQREELRQNRYRIIGFETEMMEELGGLLRNRNEVFWVCVSFDPPRLQFDFNGLWFDASFLLLSY